MKVYRVSFRNDMGEHTGHEHFSNKKLAEKIQRRDNEKHSEQLQGQVEEIEFELTKKGIIALLNIHASYPDNG